MHTQCQLADVYGVNQLKKQKGKKRFLEHLPWNAVSMKWTELRKGLPPQSKEMSNGTLILLKMIWNRGKI